MFIKEDIPSARVMTYGYNASLHGAPKNAPFQYARNLLAALEKKRLSREGAVRGLKLYVSQIL
jgi:alkylated DNA nucleotide flippase Atl1